MKHLLFLFLAISHMAIAQTSLFNQVKATNIGPTIMSGRVVAIAVNPKNPSEIHRKIPGINKKGEFFKLFELPIMYLLLNFIMKINNFFL